MHRPSWRVMLSLAVVVTAQPLRAQAGSPTLENVFRAMGGRDRVLAVRTLVMEGKGENFNFGQNLTPEAPLPRFDVTQAKRTIDFAGHRWFHEQTREPRYLTGNTAPQIARFGADRDVAYNVGAGPTATQQRVFGQGAVDRVNEIVHHPIGFLQAAFAPGSEITEDQARGALRWVRINVSGNKFAVLVDPRTNLPVRTQKITDHPTYGDVMIETEFADWKDVDGVKVPMRIITKLDEKWVVSDMRYLSARINADVGDLSVHPETRSATETPPAISVTTEEVAPGVWLIAGQSHHTVAIETSRSLVLVEAPQSEARTLAAIAAARALRPDKPISLVINTHHHFDHSGGVRAAISQGLTIATHRGNREFYERIVFPRRHFIVADALARGPKPLHLTTIDDKYVRRDSLRTIEVYHVTGSQHSASMLMVYLPAERLLIEADLYNPPTANAPAGAPPLAFPFAANLLENIRARGLQVDRIVPIHGRVVPLADVQAAAARAP